MVKSNNVLNMSLRYCNVFVTQIVGPVFCGMIGKSNIPFYSLFFSPHFPIDRQLLMLILGLEGKAVRPLRSGNNLDFNTL